MIENHSKPITFTPREVIRTYFPESIHKQLGYYLEKWERKGWYEYGVSLDMGWMTSKGVTEGMTALKQGVKEKV
jgi:hypothetical protein